MTELTKTYFSPYGFVNRSEAKNLPVIVPPDWIDQRVGTTQEQWEAWLTGILMRVNDAIWPCWDYGGSQWKAAGSVAHMEALTRTDFLTLDAMQDELLGRGLDTLPDVPHPAAVRYTQREIYIIEDDRLLPNAKEKVTFASYYGMYDATLDPAVAADVSRLFFAALDSKMANVTFNLKMKLQRPRPYQTAVLLHRAEHVYEPAQTGSTPSSCSGHSMQGLVAIGAVFDALSSVLKPDNSRALRQYAVDIGDRRVMAGVHYPSDNLVSWSAGLSLAEHVFVDSRKIKSWMWEAIAERSIVYRHILAMSKTGQGEAYKAPLDLLYSMV